MNWYLSSQASLLKTMLMICIRGESPLLMLPPSQNYFRKYANAITRSGLTLWMWETVVPLNGIISFNFPINSLTWTASSRCHGCLRDIWGIWTQQQRDSGYWRKISSECIEELLLHLISPSASLHVVSLLHSDLCSLGSCEEKLFK